MLLNFTVSNYRVFKDPASLSMEATFDKSHPDNVIVSEALKKRVLRTSVIYGANASGKTTFLNALSLMRNFVLSSAGHMPGVQLNHVPFAFDKDSLKKPTLLEADFVTNGMRYTYGFSYNRSCIVEEHLFAYPNQKKKLVFARKRQSFEFTSNKKDQEANAKKVRDNVLYLSVAAQFNHPESLEVYNWFMKKLFTVVNNNPSYLEQTLRFAKKNPRFKKLVMKASRIADFGIVDVYDRADMKEAQTAPLSDVLIPEISDIWVSHSASGRKVDMPISAESSGTIRFLNIIGPAIAALTDGQTLIVDEIDLSFHTDVCLWLVKLFMDPEENKNGAQLIFNTHDVELMNQELFRRDQVWFSIKDWEAYDADLRRLSDYKGIRKDLDLRKAYLNGVFGAKPFIEPERLME